MGLYSYIYKVKKKSEDLAILAILAILVILVKNIKKVTIQVILHRATIIHIKYM